MPRPLSCCNGSASAAADTTPGVVRQTHRTPFPTKKPTLYPLLERINAYLMRWIRKKYARLRGRKKAQDAWNQAVARRPRFFAHWAWITYAPKVW